MQNNFISRLFIWFLILFMTSCGPYQKALKSEDTKLKYDLAEAYYDEGDYRRAKGLFEQPVSYTHLTLPTILLV